VLHGDFHARLRARRHGRGMMLYADPGAGFFQQINGFIRQAAVGQVFHHQADHDRQHILRDDHLVVFLVFFRQRTQNFQCNLRFHLIHPDGLEAPVER